MKHNLLNYPNPNDVPAAVRNTCLKYGYTYIVQELLRFKHNEMGAKFRAGQITQAEWDGFLANWWKPRNNTVISDLLELRAMIQGYSEQYEAAAETIMEEIPI